MMSRNNPLWGAPRIHGELLKLGIEITEPTVAKYMPRRSKPPSQTWRTFLENHMKSMISVDFFTVPTIRFSSALCLRGVGTRSSAHSPIRRMVQKPKSMAKWNLSRAAVL
jgi:hypothetical protein